jgi:protein gp37
MGETTIEWTATIGPDGVSRKGFTFNPWIGCQKVSPGCDHCYAEAMMADRYGRVVWGPHGDRSRTSPQNWNKPRAWDRAAAATGVRAKVFCASLADVFDNHRSVLPVWRSSLWRLIAETPNLDWLLLTKRPQNIARMLPDGLVAPAWGNGWRNVWLGTTVENQAEADRRIPHLLAVPAVLRFLSCEPLLGPVDLTWRGMPGQMDALAGYIPPDVTDHTPRGLDWIIAGGESGPGARPMHPDWARSLRDQCAAARVPFLFKQWGEWAPDPEMPSEMQESEEIAGRWDGISHRIGKHRAGRLLDGVEWNGFPEARA